MGSFVNGEALNDKAILLIIRYLLFDLADRYAAAGAAGDLVSCKGAKAITSILAASIPLFMIYNMALTCKLWQTVFLSGKALWVRSLACTEAVGNY
jgi:hypothetical protein